MEQKDFAVKLKGIEEGGSFTGFAAVYDEVDLQNDSISKGAFSQSIASQGNGYPLLWSHKQDTPIGLARIEDSASALIVKGTIDRQDPDGEQAYQRAKKGYVKGISIGFSIPRGHDKVAEKDGIRYLREIRLHELSLVAVPAQPGARILSVKSLASIPALLKTLEPGALPADLVAQLREINEELKYLLPDEDFGHAALLNELKSFASQLPRVGK